MADAKKRKKRRVVSDDAPSADPKGDDVPGWEEAAMRALTASRPYMPIGVLASAALFAWLRGPGAGVLVVAGGALVFAISALWTSLRTLVGEAPVDLEAAVAIGTATAEDERKRRILQALRDLEIEHKLGKVSDDDFKVLSSQYRTEAKRILREIDEKIAPARALAEKLVAERLAGDSAEKTPPETSSACAKCATQNEPDAVFCKKCGAKLAAENP